MRVKEFREELRKMEALSYCVRMSEGWEVMSDDEIVNRCDELIGFGVEIVYDVDENFNLIRSERGTV